MQGELLGCRGPATEVYGILCQAVGTGPLQQSLPSFMQAALKVASYSRKSLLNFFKHPKQEHQESHETTS